MSKSSVPRVVSHYRIIQKIGAGGMCEVYLAEDTILKRKVALKVLSQDKVSSEDAKRRFLKEAEATARLDHPNICAIYEVGSDSDLCFIAIQYIEGQTLASKMLSGWAGLEETTDIAAQLADALAEAHAKGIIHRDIKPQNIMLTARGRVKVLDFGLAKLIQERSLSDSQDQTQSLLTGPGTLVGTIPYFSPEQARGEPIDGRSDIFSLGVVIYEMLSGRHPFKAQSEAATLSLILTHEPPPLARFLPEIPNEFQRIVSKMLSKDREMRYQAARELQIDLTRLKGELAFETRLDSESPRIENVAKASARRHGIACVEGGSSANAGETRTAKQRADLRHFFSQTRFFKQVLIGVILISIITSAGIFYLSSRKSDDSIAVLPLIFSRTDISNAADPDGEYIADGITESLINRLSQFPSLKVIARASVFRYKGREVDPQQVGRDLGVRTVFMGRIIRRGENITVNAELSDVRDNRQIWGEQYERKSSELLALQKDIARAIIGNLRLKLAADEQSRLNRSYTDNPEAYELYLKGRYYWNKRTGEGFEKAIVFFQHAIEIDPSYALAYTGLADAYMLLSDWGFLSPIEGYSKARDAVVRALSIDDRLAEAHTSLAGIKAVLDWDWIGAENEYKRAINLNPNYATAHHWYAIHLMYMARSDESLAEIRQAQRLDPLSLGINKDFAVIMLYAGRYDEALGQCRKALEIDPDFLPMYTFVAQAYEGKQMYAEAIAELQRAHSWSPEDPWISYGLAQAYALAGMKNEAQRIVTELGRSSKQSQFLPKELALLNALLGEKDKAFEILQKAYENHYFVVSELKVDPRFDSLRSDPRYADLLHRIGLR
jgi:eukaryotic-like serine/threonine-protein kinase